ncbi:MAG: hypothetical protein QNJ32_20065 [Xenococcaceae cyanobacterium MO_167.B27]|nr:hypothetical protein [Xenococcaceae cyanobacterium MO_167.B27]
MQQPVKVFTHQLLLVKTKVHGSRQSIRCNTSGFAAIAIKPDKQGNKFVTKVKPKQIYTHAKVGDIVNVTLEKDRKHVKSGIYITRVKTPTKTSVEVKINGHPISSKLFNFVHRSDGYDYSFAELLSV